MADSVKVVAPTPAQQLALSRMGVGNHTMVFNGKTKKWEIVKKSELNNYKQPYYALKDDINFETYEATSPDVGDEETLPTLISSFVSGLVIVTSSEAIESSEDLTKSTVTAVAYSAIT